jgi:hypothetical protein
MRSKNMGKAKPESTMNGLDEVGKAWNEANQAFKKGSLACGRRRSGGRRESH